MSALLVSEVSTRRDYWRNTAVTPTEVQSSWRRIFVDRSYHIGPFLVGWSATLTLGFLPVCPLLGRINNTILLYEIWIDRENFMSVQLKRPYRDRYEAGVPELLRSPRKLSFFEPIRSMP
jgi:hypothetical protein